MRAYVYIFGLCYSSFVNFANTKAMKTAEISAGWQNRFGIGIELWFQWEIPMRRMTTWKLHVCLICKVRCTWWWRRNGWICWYYCWIWYWHYCRLHAMMLSNNRNANVTPTIVFDLSVEWIWNWCEIPYEHWNEMTRNCC